MFAIIETGGKQYRVHPGDTIEIERTNAKLNEKVSFDQVLAVKENDNLQLGTPLLDDAYVSAEVVDHRKDKKIVVFKMKRRKRYRRKLGHRQLLTKVKILEVHQKGQANTESEEASP